MRKVVCHKLGDATLPFDAPDCPLRLVPDVPREPLKPGTVRVKIAASALNFADALQVKGTYQEKPPLPFVPASECSGVVIEVAPGVERIAVGDKVCATNAGNCLADEIILRAAGVLKLAPSVSEEQLRLAAGLPVTFGTAYLALFHRAKLQKGQTLLVLGAAGGVGLAAVQLGKAYGAKVVAVARGADKMAVLRKAGADACIDSRAITGPLREAIKAAAPEGVDVLLDPVGGEPHAESLKCLKWGGQILIIGFTAGVPKVAANIALVKNWTYHGIYWGAHQFKDPAPFIESLTEPARLFSEGRVQVYASHIIPMDQAPKAFDVLVKRQAIGKVLVVPQSMAAL